MARIRRDLLDLTQAELAAEIDVNQSTISRWERGELEPSREELLRIRKLAADRKIELSDSAFFEAA